MSSFLHHLIKFLTNKSKKSFVNELLELTSGSKSYTPTELIELHLKANPDGINQHDSNGFTALHLACKHNMAEIVKTLLKFNPDLNFKDKNGKIALMVAGNNPVICKLLIDAGADINVKDKYGQTALIIAAGSGIINIVEMLILANANLNFQDATGKSALMAGVIDSCLTICKSLLTAGADCSLIDSYGHTAYYYANPQIKLLLSPQQKYMEIEFDGKSVKKEVNMKLTADRLDKMLDAAIILVK